MKYTIVEYNVEQRNESCITSLIAVWEASVLATHDFLTPAAVMKIKQYIPEALLQVEHLVVANDNQGQIVGFAGITDDLLEMLFLAPEVRGKGLGRVVLTHAIHQYGVQKVTVNEQNPQAKTFYEHMGFQVYRRSSCDEQGNPYPILYMCWLEK